MFEMLSGLYRLRSEGYAIGIVAFNGVREEVQRARFADLPSQGAHEAAQAENIGSAARAGSYDKVLTLLGNLQALMGPPNFGSGRFDPMAKRLEAYRSVLSFSMKYTVGTNWSCRRNCAANLAEANASFGREPFIALLDTIAKRIDLSLKAPEGTVTYDKAADLAKTTDQIVFDEIQSWQSV